MPKVCLHCVSSLFEKYALVQLKPGEFLFGLINILLIENVYFP